MPGRTLWAEDPGSLWTEQPFRPWCLGITVATVRLTQTSDRRAFGEGVR